MNRRNTIQRDLVHSAAIQLDHPTADAVYGAVAESYPSISRGTVYRNLNLLVSQGRLRKVPLPDSADRFDCTLAAHYHICCKRCGKVVDAALPYQSNLLDSIGETCGFLIEEHDIVLKGICPDCRQLEGAGGTDSAG